MILFTPYVVDFIFKIRKYLSINRFEGQNPSGQALLILKKPIK